MSLILVVVSSVTVTYAAGRDLSIHILMSINKSNRPEGTKKESAIPWYKVDAKIPMNSEMFEHTWSHS